MPVAVGNWQDSHQLTSVTHLDGRNAGKLFSLRPYFSELAWMKERLFVLVSHLISLAPLVTKPMRAADERKLYRITSHFSLADGERVRAIEKTVNHDLKALEMFLSAKMTGNLKQFKRFLLFGLGSEDINSLALARLITKSRGEVLVPELAGVIESLANLASKEKETLMIGRTHGLPAGLTTLGKELANPLFRLCDELITFNQLRIRAKLSGEIGSLHSLSASSVKVDWFAFGDRLIKSLGVEPSRASTQIVSYDSVIRYLHSLFRINSILIDLCKNMWLYVLIGYCGVVKKDKEVGSSGMPHKVNPIYFEGAEGGLVMANGLIETLARALPINRLQRDFSDSTVRRNISLLYAYSLLSYQSLIEALRRTEVRRDVIAADVKTHAEVWVEPIKIIMIESGFENAYELLKRKTRGQTFTENSLKELVSTLPIDASVKKKIFLLVSGGVKNPYPSRLVKEALARVKKIT